jgi:hypothetical protein
MKISVFYFLALAISFEALAYESDEKSIGDYQQESLVGTSTINAQAAYAVSWSQAKAANDAEDQGPSEKQVTLLTVNFYLPLDYPGLFNLLAEQQ